MSPIVIRFFALLNFLAGNIYFQLAMFAMLILTFLGIKDTILEQLRQIVGLMEYQNQVADKCNLLWERIDGIERMYKGMDIEGFIPNFTLPYVDVYEAVQDFQNDLRHMNIGTGST